MPGNSNNIPTLNIERSLRNGLSIKVIDDRARNHPEIFLPHRDNHYMIILGFSGSYNMMVDFDIRTSTGPAVSIVLPGQVHQLLDLESPEGIAIDFDPLFIPKELEYLFYSQPAFPRTTSLTAGYLSTVKEVVALLHHTLPDRPGYSEGFVTSLFNTLLMLIKDLLGAGNLLPTPFEKSRSIPDEFALLLQQNFRVWKRPAQYADALFISPGYLNEAVSNATGKSVSVHIQHTSILEAKRLLFFTGNDVRSICYEVGYEDPAYFSRLFKKLTGVTPLKFRKQIHDQSYINMEQTYS